MTDYESLCCGFRIDARPARITSTDPPLVAMFQMGITEGRSFLTPDEARRLSKALFAAAEAADRKP